jgi:hypothetical protein
LGALLQKKKLISLVEQLQFFMSLTFNHIKNGYEVWEDFAIALSQYVRLDSGAQILFLPSFGGVV